MAVYAICTHPSCRCRRDADPEKPERTKCVDLSAHKKFVKWKADVQFSRRSEDRYRKLFRMKEDADSQERQWYTDHERQELRPRAKAVVLFGTLADKYWIEHAKIKCRNPHLSSHYHVERVKTWVGVGRKISPLSDNELQQFKLDIEQVQRTQQGNGLKASSVNRILKVLRSIFERGKEWGLIKVNPMDMVKDLEEDEPPLRFLEIEEIEKLRRAVETLPEYVRTKKEAGELPDFSLTEVTPEQVVRLRDRVTVYLHTGARPSSQEECNWDNGDVDMTNKVIWFTTYKGGRTRKKHRYPHPIDNELYQVLLRRAEVTGKKGPVFDCSGLRKLEDLAIKASGVNEGKSDKQWFTMYGLKHCYASHLIMSGSSEGDVAELLGHTDTAMVHKHYKHLTLTHLRNAQSKVNLTPPLFNIVG